MSKEIDEKVVSMQFDNRNFETNVKTTMSTLEKLKEKLHFKGATKGLEDLSAATNKINLNPLASGVEAVSVKFSALQVAGITAITNLTNSAVNAGKRIVSALTIDPVKTGFSEYELKMDSVKTIMASTGEELEKVNEYLEELNEYSDQTIYSFSDMTQNIGKFTNAGVKLEDAVLAIKGISNEAALSGANANEASRAMYNFAQALSVGYIQRIDWKSIELANMATVEFKEQLLDAAVAAGTVKKSADGMYETIAHPGKAYNAAAMFTETLDDQWLTTEVLINTLKQYSDATTDIGKRAFAAAQDVTKLSQMFDVLKETAQSGWAKTWEIIFGDIEQAKSIFTPMTDFFSKIINSISDFRNNLLEGAFANPFKALFDKLDNSGLGTIKKYVDAIDSYADKLEYFQKVVTDVWRGDYNNHGDNPDRYNLLDEAGYNHKVVQSLVNKGYLYQLTVDDIKAAHEKFGLSLEGTTESINETAIALEDLTDEQLRNAGFTAEEIKLFRELANEAKRTGKPLKELIDELSSVDGRTLLIESFQNIGGSLVKIFTAIKDAWIEIFPPMTTVQLFNIIRAFNRLSEHLSMNDFTANKLKRTLKGVFALIDIITTVTGGALKIALKAIAKVLGIVDIDVLDITANLGDFLVAIRDTIDELNIFERGIEVLVPALSKLWSAFRNWIKGLKETDNIPEYIINSLINGFKKGGKLVVNAAVNLGKKLIRGIERVFGIDIPGGKFVEIGKNIIAGLDKGIFEGAKTVIKTIIDLGKKLIEGIKNVLGIHSPSREFYEIGMNIIQGLINGLQNGSNLVWDVVRTIGLKLIDIIKELDIGTLFAGIVGIGMTVAAVKVANALEGFSELFEGLGSMLESVGDMLEDVGKGVKSFLKGAAWKMKADALLSLAIAIGILAASLYVLSKVKPGPLWNAVGAVSVLIILMGGLLAVVAKTDDLKGIGSKGALIAAVAISVLIMAFALEKLAGIDGDDAVKGVLLMASIVIAMKSLLKAMNGLSGKNSLKDISKIGGMMMKLSIALLLMIAVVAIAGNMDTSTITQGVFAIGAISLLFALLIGISKLAGQWASSSGGMILKMSMALLLIIGVVKLAAMLSQSEVNKGIQFIGSVLILFGVFTILTALASAVGKNASKVGTMMLKISFAFLIMVGIIKLIGMMSQSEIEKGLGVITQISALFATIILLSGITAAVGKEASKVGTMMIKISVAMLLMVGVIAILSLFNPDALNRAVKAISVIELLFIGMIAVTGLIAKGENTENTVKILTRLAIVIGLMAAIVAGLSFIEPTRLAIATTALSAVIGMFALLMKATKSMKVDKKLQTQMLWMTGVVAALGIIIGLLSLAEPERALAAAGSLSAVMLAFSGAMAIMKNVAGGSKAVYAQMGIMLLITLGLAVILSGLSMLDPMSVLPSAVALSLLMEALASSMLIISKAKSVTMTSMAALGIMTGVVALLAVILGVMYGLGVEASIPTAIALGILLNSMAIAMAILSSVGAVAQLAVPAAIALVEVVTILGAFILALGALNELCDGGVANLVSSGGAVLEAIGLAIGKFIGAIFGGISEGVYAGMPGIGEKLSAFAENSKKFFDLIDSVKPESVESLAVLSGALLDLTTSNLIDSLTSFFGGTSIDDFGDQLGILGEGLNKFAVSTAGINSASVESAANAVAILAEVSNELPKQGGMMQDIFGTVNVKQFGEHLVDLGKGLKGFVDAIGPNFSSETVESAANAAKALAEVANEIPKQNGLMQNIFGNTDIQGFSRQLQRFGQGIAEFAVEIKGVNPETVTAAANSAKVLAEVANEIPKQNGLMQNIFGDTDITGFARQLTRFGQGIAEFAKEIDGVDSETVEASANAALALAEVANNVPKEDGWMQKIFGKSDLGSFSNQLSAFGKGLKLFSDEVAGIEDVDKTGKAAKAAESIAGVATVLKDNDSVWDYFTEKDESATRLSNFGGQLETLGQGMKKFADSILGIENMGDVSKAAEALKDIATLAKVLDENRSFIDKVFNSEDSMFENFGNDLEELGEALDTFWQKIKYISVDKTEQAVTIASKLVELIHVFVVGDTAIGDIAAANLPAITSAMSTIGDGIKEFVDKINPLDFSKTEQAMTAIDGIIDIMGTIPTIQDMRLSYLGSQLVSFTTSLSTFCTNIKSLNFEDVKSGLTDIDTIVKNINTIVDSFSEEIGKKEPVFKAKGISLMEAVVEGIKSTGTDFYNTGKEQIGKLGEGVSAKETTTALSNVFNKLIGDMIVTIKTEQRYADFMNTGKYLVQGFATGVTVESAVAEQAARTMATRILSTINAVFGVESPSKEMYKTAMFCNQGFANGIDATTYKSERSVDRMAESVKLRFTTAIAKIKDMLENGVDSQPTIRPVLDLSAVASGAKGINDLFSTSPIVGVAANVNAISSTMSKRQNGSNDDVVSAIKDLEESINSRPTGDTYTIDGITYDDGSAVSSAIKVLTRYAKMERRR